MAINCYFSSTHNISEIITTQILKARDSILLAMYTLTDRDLIDALKQKRQNGIDILSIFDETQLTKYSNIIFELNNSEIVFKTIGKKTSRMHHKFLVIDKHTVISGSFNWTLQANISNLENIIVVEDESIAKKYTGEFDRIWQSISSKNIREYLTERSQSSKNSGAYVIERSKDNSEKFNERYYVRGLEKTRYNYSKSQLRAKILKDLSNMETSGKYLKVLTIIKLLEKTDLNLPTDYIAQFKRKWGSNSS
jgi:phosphatidylserine/phosphatidylglycerophosphate/cardiolipin synthase-like enzyme